MNGKSSRLIQREKCTLKAGFQNALFAEWIIKKHLGCCRFAFLQLSELLPCMQVIIERKKHLKTISFRDTGPHSTSPHANHIETHCWNTIICLYVSSKAVLLALVVTAHIFTLYVCGGGTSFISGFCFLSSFGQLVEVSCRQGVQWGKDKFKLQ